MKYRINTQKAFTVIEVIVSVSLFVTVMVVSTSALLAVIDANKKAQSVRAVLDNLTTAIESMTRDIRIGTQYRCGDGRSEGNDTYPNCPTVAAGLDHNRIFTYCDKELGTDVTFRYIASTKQLQRGVDPDGNCTTESGWNYEDFITSDVELEDVRFFVSGANDTISASDPYETLKNQASALIVIRGHAGRGKYRTEFSLQTTVTQRDSDYGN